MKKDIFLFYETNHNPMAFFNIKKIAAKNNIIVNFRPYSNEEIWKDFIKNFISVSNLDLIENNVTMTLDYQGFVLVYTDEILNKKIIILDENSILNFLSN